MTVGPRCVDGTTKSWPRWAWLTSFGTRNIFRCGVLPEEPVYLAIFGSLSHSDWQSQECPGTHAHPSAVFWAWRTKRRVEQSIGFNPSPTSQDSQPFASH